MPQYQVMLHFRPPEIEIAVLEPNGFIHFDIILNIKRRGFGRIQNTELLPADFHRTGFHQWIHRIFGAQPNLAANGHDILGADSIRLFKSRPIDLRRKNHLHDARTIPQIHKNQSAVITLP